MTHNITPHPPSPAAEGRRTGRILAAAEQRHSPYEGFLSASGAAIVEFELGPGTYHMTDVGHLGRLDQTGPG